MAFPKIGPSRNLHRLFTGAGSDFAAWVSSNFKRLTKGSREQVILAGTSANNAAVAGTWIPALSLGIPGDTLTAIILGLFLTLGIRPGPELLLTTFTWWLKST